MKTHEAVRLNALSNLVPPIAGILSAPILARGLGVAERGDVAGISVNLTIAATALTLGLPEALTYYTGRDGEVARHRFNRVILVLAGVGTLAGVALLLGADVLGYTRESFAGLFVVSISVPLVLALSALRGLAAGASLWKRIAVERLVTSLLRLVVLLALWTVGGLSVTSAVATIAGTTILGALCYLPVVSSLSPTRGRATSRAQDLASFGLRYWPGALAGALLIRVDQFLMVPLSTSEQLGLYVTAITLYEAASFASNALRDVIFSAESQEQNVARVAIAARLAGTVTLLVATTVGLVSIPLVPLVFGRDFSGAVPVLALLLPAGVLGASSSIAAAALSGWGKAGWRSAGLVLSLAVKIVAIVLLVPHSGAAGAAIATVIGTAVVWCVIAAVMWREYSLTPRDLLIPRRSDFAYFKQMTGRRVRAS